MIVLPEPPQDELQRVVRGLTAFLMEFDGPPTHCVGETQYFTLAARGGFQEAVELYAEMLREEIKRSGAQQLAWRTRPRVERDGERFKVYSRLALLKSARAADAVLVTSAA